ncbi:MAG: cyclase family protein [bacterium]|nr:cyclase family protein [bacterium]
MKLVDLSHPLSPDMPVYPGTEPPLFTTACSFDEFGFREKKITMYSHTGTHIDAPAHILREGKTLDQFPVDHFVGKALLLDLTSIKKKHIDLPELAPHQDALRVAQFLLLHTGWSRFWGTEGYFSEYPTLSPEAALWLGDLGLKGLGLDMISADETGSDDLPIHNSCLPLKIQQADGSPVRAVAIMD